MALLYFQPGTDSRGAATPCPDGMVSGNNALAVRCALFRRSMPDRGQKHTAKPEHGTKAGNQLDKESEREDGI